MTDDLEAARLHPETPFDGFEAADLDGHTIDELSDYLDASREPRDASIENSPACQIAMEALARLHTETWAMLETESQLDPNRDHTWISNVLNKIAREARAGRDIPISHPTPATDLATEGSECVAADK